MSDSACNHWVALSDRVALGERLTPHELSFQRKHEASCANCRAECAIWCRLGDARRDPAVLTEPENWEELGRGDATIGAAARLFRGRAGSALLPRPARALAWALAATGAVAAATLVVRHATRQEAPAAPLTRVGFVVVSGEVTAGSRAASAGTELRAAERVSVGVGRACLSFEPSVAACLAGASEAEVSSTEPARRALALRRGQVLAKLEPQPSGMTFRVETPRGAAIAKGTVFAVEVAANRDVLVRVHEGTVLWQGHDGREQSLSAPTQAKFADNSEFGALTEAAAERDEALIRLAALWSAGAKCRLDVEASPAGARVLLDGSELGPAPVSALVSGGHRLSLDHPGYAPLSERLWLTDGEHVSRSYQLVALPSSAPGPARAAAPAEPTVDTAALPRASELLSRARALRAGGRSAEAATAYRRLLAAYPRSDEARASLVSLGELLLSELGDPAAALRAFDSYLKAGGGLAQEARYGRVRALARLGRRAEERAAIEQFLLDYPRSVQATSLRARLASPR